VLRAVPAGEAQRGQVPVARGPDDERPGGVAGAGAGGEPGVEVGLTGLAERDARGLEVGEQLPGDGDLLAGGAGGAGLEPPGGGRVPRAAQVVPAREAVKQPGCGGAVLGQGAAQPGLEQHEGAVGRGEGAAADEELTQVHRGPGRGVGVEGGVGQGEPAAGEVGEQAADVGVAQPDQGAAAPGLGADRLEQGREVGPDVAGAVVEQAGEVVAQAAAGAEPAAVRLVLRMTRSPQVGCSAGSRWSGSSSACPPAATRSAWSRSARPSRIPRRRRASRPVSRSSWPGPRPLAELLSAHLSGLDLVALMVDGVHFGEHVCVVRARSRCRVADVRLHQKSIGAGFAKTVDAGRVRWSV
jgi:hypothetical protein